MTCGQTPPLSLFPVLEMLGKYPLFVFSDFCLFVLRLLSIRHPSCLSFPSTGIISPTMQLDGLLIASEAQSLSAKEETGAALTAQPQSSCKR